jgi:histidinol phosphatase-like PHP family hydrolase
MIFVIDLHSHTFHSDGALGPAELARRAAVKGIKVLAYTDHTDSSNAHTMIPAMVNFCDGYNGGEITVIPGAELTHVPPAQIADLVKTCREYGAKLVSVHGETIVEPVSPGTNLAAIKAGVDIIAHPGLIGVREVKLAAKLGVLLEITGRKGHAFANGHVVAMAREYGAGLVFSTDTHAPSDLMDKDMAFTVARGAGMTKKEINMMFENAARLVESII